MTLLIARKGHFYVQCTNGEAELLPLYVMPDVLHCGGIVLPLKIKEIETESEFTSYQQLSEFHYRSKFGYMVGLPSSSRQRTSLSYQPFWGYIQLATPFFMNKCRSTLVNAPFESGPINWKTWDKAASRKYINVFVRIARTVVHPEFRGLGLGQLLVRHANNFASTHWHVAGLQPSFLEIVADMLKYVPFTERGGMHLLVYRKSSSGRKGHELPYRPKEKGTCWRGST